MKILQDQSSLLGNNLLPRRTWEGKIACFEVTAVVCSKVMVLPDAYL